MTAPTVRQRTILLADDGESFLELERSFFANVEVRILVARDGREALRLVEQERPDLALIDESMPGLKGHEVCRVIKGDVRLKDTPVVIVTASTDAASVDACMAAGCDGYLVKPVGKNAVLHVAEKLLNTRQRRRLRMLVKIAHARLGTGGSPDFFFGYTIDISDGGMLLELRERVAEGEELDLEFFLPGQSDKICARGRVVRRNQEGDEAIGIELVQLSDAARERIRRYVQRMGLEALLTSEEISS